MKGIVECSHLLRFEQTFPEFLGRHCFVTATPIPHLVYLNDHLQVFVGQSFFPLYLDEAYWLFVLNWVGNVLVSYFVHLLLQVCPVSVLFVKSIDNTVGQLLDFFVRVVVDVVVLVSDLLRVL